MKKATLIILGLSCLLVSGHPLEELRQPALDAVVTGNITLDNGLPYGSWGSEAFCNSGSYARDIEVMFQDYNILHTDETAVNAIKLSCMVPGGHHTGQIASTIGERGDWMGLRSCQSGLMTGMRAQVLEYRGSLGDDVAVQNVEMSCNYNESTVIALENRANMPDGEWSEWGECDQGSAICGIKVRYERPFLIEDTVGISDIIMYCCNVEVVPATTLEPRESTTYWPEPTTIVEDEQS
ncbi:vitelline membrane outer layer protein 1-like [Palaemon carinicauda]|uniref:vitelline membrane outer layer protein 1-like n=1 Tax=Palaemon carinicauda TaxID=392227 RepID=UPI0035B57999